MKLKLNPMDQVVKRAERRINLHRVASTQDLAHDRKRQIAQAVLAGIEPPPEFQQAAEIEGVSVEALANIIVSKPDVLMMAENGRRTMIVAVRKAKSPQEVDAILADIPENPADRRMDLLP